VIRSIGKISLESIKLTARQRLSYSPGARSQREKRDIVHSFHVLASCRVLTRDADEWHQEFVST